MTSRIYLCHNFSDYMPVLDTPPLAVVVGSGGSTAHFPSHKHTVYIPFDSY